MGERKQGPVPAGTGRDDERLVEVWGDVVDERQVVWAVLLGCVLAVPSFYGALEIFSGAMDNQDLARTYAMLVGLAACLVAAAIAARRFPPKRTVVEGDLDPADQREALRELAAEPGGLGRIADLSPAERRELEDLGLLELFAQAEADALDARPDGATRAAAGGEATR
ncbi:hypothetical protein ACVU7I_07090 [Patulibacter sp. S7RM1-6]